LKGNLQFASKSNKFKKCCNITDYLVVANLFLIFRSRLAKISQYAIFFM
jgi:hypothetical protein